MPVRFENVAIAVRDLEEAVAFFTDLGLIVLGRDTVSGEWAATAVGLDGNHVRLAMLQTPDGGGRIELFEYLHPEAIETEPTRPNEIGMHRVALSVDSLDDALAIAARHGCHPLRGVGTYQDLYRLTYVRGPSGIIVMLAEALTSADVAPDAAPNPTAPAPIPTQRLAAFGIARRDGAVLLVRCSEHSEFPGQWSLPGGGVDHGEHPLDTVVREFREETGLAVRVVGPPSIHSDADVLRGGTLHQHSVRIVVDVEVTGGTPSDEADGTTDLARWVPADDVGALPLLPFTREALALPDVVR